MHALRLVSSLLLAVSLVVVAGCGGGTTGADDAALHDAGADGAARDAGPDASGPDAEARDAGAGDAGVGDAGAGDAGVGDAGACNGVCEAGDPVACPMDCWVCVPGTVEACYTGPVATEGHGLCHGGMHTCAADGAAFGPCAGEVLPAPEDCATPADEDCDGLSPACSGATTFGRVWGGLNDDEWSSVALTPDGEVVVGGSIGGVVDFGCGPVVPATTGNQNAAWARFDSSGACLRSAQLAITGSSAVQQVAVLPGGDVVLAGYFSGSIELGATVHTSVGVRDLFLARLASDASVVWAHTFGSVGSRIDLGGLAADGSEIVIAGGFVGSIDLGRGPMSGAGSTDVFVAAFHPSGSLLWSRRFGDSAAQVAHGVALDAASQVFVVGDLAGSVSFGGPLLTSVGANDAFVAAFDAMGTHLWSGAFGGTAADQGLAVATAPSGDVVIGGVFGASIDFGGGMLTSAGASDGFVARFSGASGAHLASRALQGPGTQTVTALATTSSGDAIVAGVFATSVTLGSATLTTVGATDIFLARLDAGNAVVWQHAFGSTNADAVRDVATSDVLLAMVGLVAGPIDFGTGTSGVVDAADAFLALLAP